jgi:hypothetical protein
VLSSISLRAASSPGSGASERETPVQRGFAAVSTVVMGLASVPAGRGCRNERPLVETVSDACDRADLALKRARCEKGLHEAELWVDLWPSKRLRKLTFRRRRPWLMDGGTETRRPRVRRRAFLLTRDRQLLPRGTESRVQIACGETDWRAS